MHVHTCNYVVYAYIWIVRVPYHSRSGQLYISVKIQNIMYIIIKKFKVTFDLRIIYQEPILKMFDL